MKLLAWCATLLCLWLSAIAQDTDINNIIKQLSDELIKGTFMARVEVNSKIGSNSRTYTIIEYHDSTTGVHSIDMAPLNIRKMYFANLATKTFVTVNKLGTCEVQDAATAADKELFLFKSDARLTDYFFGPTGAITMLPDLKPVENATKTVRGIPVKAYSNEGTTDAQRRKVLVYFPASDWAINVLSEKKIPFPVRIEVSMESISEQTDFYQVRDLSPKEVYRLGDGLQLPVNQNGCKLPLPSNVKAPELSNMFSFTAETSDGMSATEYFSLMDKLYRADQWDGLSVIQDDQRGLKYTLEQECRAQPNDLADSTIVSSGSTNPGAIIIQAYQILKEKFLIGETVVRGVPVEVWEAVGKSDRFKSARFFFAKASGVVAANAEETSGRILMQAQTRSQSGPEDDLWVNVYNFYSTLDSLDFRKNFNIEACVEASVFVDVVYQATKVFNIDEFKASNAMSEIMEATGEAIVATTGVGPLQLPFMEAEIKDERHVQVFAKILAAPAYLSSFTERREKYKHYTLAAKDSQSEENCAQQCVENKCATFLYCPGEAHCYLMNVQESSKWGPVNTDSQQNCRAFDKSLNAESFTRTSLENVTELLEKALLMGLPQFATTVRSSEGRIQLRGFEFFAHLSQFNKQGSLGPYQYQIGQATINASDVSSVEVADKIPTAGACYRECRANKDVSCSSFSICTATQKCVLTGLNLNAGSRSDDAPGIVQQATSDCTIYSVNYLSEFDKLDGKTRRSGSLANSDGTTAGDCAVKCRQTDLPGIEECRSFDFCAGTGKCYYYRTHYGWDGGDDALKVDAECDHYALRYSASYTAIGKGTFSRTAKKVQGISFEECAKQCSELSNEECKTISYCDSPLPAKEVQTCYMYNVNPEDAGPSNRENTCTVYAKDAAIIDEVINPNRQAEKLLQYNFIGMRNGAFAFLLIVMLAVGAVIGAFGYLYRDRISSLVGRARSSASPETTISYNRQEDEGRANLDA